MTVQFLDDTNIGDDFFWFQNPNRPRAQYRSRYLMFAQELRANPRRWAALPGDKPLTLAQAKIKRGNIRTGNRRNLDSTPAPFRTGIWEADVHQNPSGDATVYVRYMGEA